MKFVADVIVHTQHEVQKEVDKIVAWSFELLSIEKTILLHAGCHQPLHSYATHGSDIKSIDNFMDLGVQRSSCTGYSGHCEVVACKANRIAGTIRRAFPKKPREIMWPAFQIYVLLVLMYALTA